MDEEEEPDELHVRGLGAGGGAALAWAGARVLFDPGLPLRAPAAASPAGAAAGPQVSAEAPGRGDPGGSRTGSRPRPRPGPAEEGPGGPGLRVRVYVRSVHPTSPRSAAATPNSAGVDASAALAARSRCPAGMVDDDEMIISSSSRRDDDEIVSPNHRRDDLDAERALGAPCLAFLLGFVH